MMKILPLLLSLLLCLVGTCSVAATSTPQTNQRQQQRALRKEFVDAMNAVSDGAKSKEKQKMTETLHRRLAEAARPAHSYPGYEPSSSNSNSFQEEAARNLEEYQDYGVNLTEYALKYIGCSNIKTWSDEEAAEGEGSVLQTDRFVVLRLCPRDECSNYNEYGCMEQFGDYLIPMEIYLQIMAETFFTEYYEYCETCYECMTGNEANNNNNNNNNGNGQNYYNNNGNQNNYYNNNNNNGGNRRLDQNANANDDAWYANNNNNGNNYNNNANGGNYNDDGGGNYNNGNGGDDDAWYNPNNWYNGDDANAANDDANAAAQGNDDQYNNANNNAYNAYANCEYYAVCENYQTACQDYTNLGFDLLDYFECAEFNIGNGAVGYMGPHCSSDGKTISMGVFSDEYCNDFSASLEDMSAYVQVSATTLDAYTSDNCISCLASDGYTLEAGNNNNNNGDGQYDVVSDICGELYGEAAKCNKYMGNNGDYASYNQEMQENRVCGFIENLLSNSYDEYGEIVLQSDESWMQYVPDINGMPQWQKYVLSASLFLAVGLFAYACYLHRQLTQRKFVWYPRGRRGYSGNPGDPTAISGRMHSGIIQGRSRSSGEFEMKNGGLLS